MTDTNAAKPNGPRPWRRRAIWLLAALAVTALLAWAFAPRPLEVETATAAIGRFEQDIEDDGRTRVRDRYAIATPVTARLERISLREGDPVRAGQVVAQLRPLMPGLLDGRSNAEAEARHRAAGAAVARASARQARARVSEDEALLALRRAEQLAAQGFVSAAALDDARLALGAARRELDVAGAERDIALQEQAAAAAALLPAGAAPRSAAPLPVRSPVAGVVLRVAQPSEATLAAGTVLMEVADPARLEVVAELLTTDAVQARPGTPVRVERWGGAPLAARVRRIEPAAFTKVSALGIEEQRVRVLIDLDEAPAAWRSLGDGFRVTVRVITLRQDDALLVPVGALFPHGEGMAVYVLEAGRARLRPIVLGGRGGNHAWVTSGLTAGQQLVMYPPAALTDGARVRVRRVG